MGRGFEPHPGHRVLSNGFARLGVRLRSPLSVVGRHFQPSFPAPTGTLREQPAREEAREPLHNPSRRRVRCRCTGRLLRCTLLARLCYSIASSVRLARPELRPRPAWLGPGLCRGSLERASSAGCILVGSLRPLARTARSRLRRSRGSRLGRSRNTRCRNNYRLGSFGRSTARARSCYSGRSAQPDRTWPQAEQLAGSLVRSAHFEPQQTRGDAHGAPAQLAPPEEPPPVAPPLDPAEDPPAGEPPEVTCDVVTCRHPRSATRRPEIESRGICSTS